MCKRLIDFFRHKPSADDLKMKQISPQYETGGASESKVALAQMGSLHCKHTLASASYKPPRFLSGIFHRDRNATVNHHDKPQPTYKM